MPKKRPVATRIAEAKEKVERLMDEQRLITLREKMRSRAPRRRRR